MRFSAIQEEDGYGVGLGQEHLASDVDDRMMAATGEILPDGTTMVDDSSMTYNLPLLFANGYPTSLDKISLTELERFITFMVQCCSDPMSTEPTVRPQWWPKEVQFSSPFVRPKKINDDWMGILKKLVFRCYTYHRSEYLLRFCSYLAQYPREKFYYVNNWDSTTSLYHKGTGKLLATFRNENMEYDKVNESPRRKLLSQNHPPSQSSCRSKKSKEKKPRPKEDSSLVVIQPQLQEIYLCDSCDAEFGDLEQMKDHEKICGAHIPNNISPRPATPIEPIVDPELDQDQFLNYFHLSGMNAISKPSTQKESSPLPSPTIFCEPVRNTRRVRTTVNLTRCPTIPFSSPAGLIMATKSKTMTEITQQERLDRLERHLTAPPLNKFSRPKWLDRFVEYNRWVVSYKPNRDKSAQDYIHKYTFGAFKRKPALTMKSQLLYVACRKSYVRLERLSPEKLEDLKQHPWKYRSPIPRWARSKSRPRPMPKSKQSANTATKRRHTISVNDECPIKEKRRITDICQETSQPCTEEKEKTIILVDLCSSDEEEEPHTPVQSDENRDPMSTTEAPAKINSFVKGSIHQGNFRSRSLSYASTPMTNWLRHGVLSPDNEKHTSGAKYLGNTIDPTKTYASVLKSSPPFKQ